VRQILLLETAVKAKIRLSSGHLQKNDSLFKTKMKKKKVLTNKNEKMTTILGFLRNLRVILQPVLTKKSSCKL